MTEESKNDGEDGEETAAHEAAEPEAPTDGAAVAETESDPAAELGAALEQAREQLEVAEDRALRAAAEAENVRRRADRSIENARKFALEKFLGDLLPAVDSFERAADAVAKADGAEQAIAAMAEGLELSLKLLREAMERQGIAALDPLGEPFDPALHEAMTMVDNPESEPNTVLEVFQKGYTLNGRLARPARVIVARQPPEQDAESKDGKDS